MGGSILMWLVVGGVITAVAGGVGYALATFNYLKIASANDRTREELQKLLAAAESRAALSQAEKPAAVVESAAASPPAAPGVLKGGNHHAQPAHQNSGPASCGIESRPAQDPHADSGSDVPGNLLEETVEETHTDVQVGSPGTELEFAL